MEKTMFNKFVHTCIATRLPADVWVRVVISDLVAGVRSVSTSAGVGVKVPGGVLPDPAADVLADVYTVVVATAAIDSEIAVGAADAPNGLDRACDGGSIGVVTGISVDSLTSTNVEMTASDFTLCPEISPMGVAFCRAAARCRPMGLFDLQTRMPTYHV